MERSTPACAHQLSRRVACNERRECVREWKQISSLSGCIALRLGFVFHLLLQTNVIKARSDFISVGVKILTVSVQHLHSMRMNDNDREQAE